MPKPKKIAKAEKIPKIVNAGEDKPKTDSDVEQQFEVELCWCIQQLHTALRIGKLNSKQVHEHTQTLNTLMSNRVPLIKKRQVMRVSFGDYRCKMETEDKRLKKANMNIRLTAGKPNQKSVCVKKSSMSSNPEKKSTNIDHNREENVLSDSSFKFNFVICDNEPEIKA